MKNLLTTIALVLSTTAATWAWAGDNDFVLHRFRSCNEDSGGTCYDGLILAAPLDATDPTPNPVVRVIPDSELFGEFVQELGIALAPRALEPAETLGQAGFSFGIASSWSKINNNELYWQRAMRDGNKGAPDYLTTLHMQLRKGLPFSFELGGSLTYLADSEMFALGSDLKWAINEGFKFLPDISLRAGVARLVGNRDLDLLAGSADLAISHPFAIGGVISLTPYAGITQVLVHAASHVLDATPELDSFPSPHCVTDAAANNRGTDISTNQATEECVRAVEAVESMDLRANFVLAGQDRSVTRGYGGLRLQYTVLAFLLEGAHGGGVSTITSKVSLEF